MTVPVDADFRRAYEVFARGHQRQRAALVAKLAEADAKPQAASRPWRRTMTMRAALAAVLVLVAGTVALFGLRGPERVYGVEGLKERLLAIRSIHIKGWLYQQTKTEFGMATVRFPTETFHERPYRQYHMSYGFSTGGDEALERVTRSAIVGDRSRLMFVDHDGKRAIISPTDELNAELAVEQMLQMSLIEKLGQGAPADYQQVGVERIDNVPCDVYEYVESADSPIRFRLKLWLNPTNGMPVKVAGYVIEDDSDMPFWEWTEIALNVQPPADMFSFSVPKEYERIEPPAGTPAPPLSAMMSGATSGDFYFSAWVGLNIDDRAVLVCWTGRSGEGDEAKWFDKTPEFDLAAMDGGPQPCDEIALWTGEVGDDRWRWSLIMPRDGAAIGNAFLNMTRTEERSSASLGTLPLAFPEQRLTKLVEEVQRRTLPADAAESEIWTLPELRAKLAAR